MIIKCLLCFAITASVVSFLGGMVIGAKFEKETICGDIMFYYHGDLPVKDCVNKVYKADK